MNNDKVLVSRWQDNMDESAILQLYKENFSKVKGIILKSFFYKEYEILLEKDDLVQILDISFIEALNTYNVKDSDFNFSTHFYFIAKYKILGTYRKYTYNKKKVFKKSFSEQFFDTYTLDKLHSYEFKNKQDERLNELEQRNQKKFLLWFYNNMSNEDLNKKILYYKFKNYSSKDISKKMKLDIRVVIYRWNNLRMKLKKHYYKWKSMQNN